MTSVSNYEQVSAIPMKQRLSLSLISHFRSPKTDDKAIKKTKAAVAKITKLVNLQALHTLEIKKAMLGSIIGSGLYYNDWGRAENV